MNFLLTFPTTCAAVYLLRKPIKRWPVVFYLCAIALDTLYLASGFIVLPRWLWGILVELVQRCELALALFAIVMLIGCLDSTSRLHRRLSPIRGELSIIAWILAMSHVTVYAVSYLPRLLSTNNLDENIVVSMAVALILLALLTVLGITSLNVVKRIMTATTWNRAQRLSYVFFGLVFCHLAFILAPAALHGGIAAQRSLLVYTALFGAYTILRIAKAIGNGHARRQPRVTQGHQPDCLFDPDEKATA